MREIIEASHHRPDRRVIPFLLSLTALVLGSIVTLWAFDATGSATAGRSDAVEAVNDWPARELPPEWQWQPRGVDVEHMYRNPKPQRLDWIR